MNRVVGIETEYGCLVRSQDSRGGPDAWPVRVKNFVFKRMRAGAIDLHYRDYEEPPGNGGFLLNGGRLYLDMGHLEYASPESRGLRDAVTYDLAGDALLQSALNEMGLAGSVSFIKNNVDHCTGATFGCHENYLMHRASQFSAEGLGALLSFLATRQLFAGAGRVGHSNPLAFDFEQAKRDPSVTFQISQRSDHIVNDIYQWVQFNRAIINARDEPLADFRKYRRLHLLIGDSNMSPFATALKIGTTCCVLALLEDGLTPRSVSLADAVGSTRALSRRPDGPWSVELEDGRTRDALDIQSAFLESSHRYLRGRDPDLDWVMEQWAFTLQALRSNREALIGGVDWISKRWMLQTFVNEEGLQWDDPWLQSLDLEYHDINPCTGLFHALKPGSKIIGEFNANARKEAAMRTPPKDTRAAGRGAAVAALMREKRPYVINWDSIALENQGYLAMGDPLSTYACDVERFFQMCSREESGSKSPE